MITDQVIDSSSCGNSSTTSVPYPRSILGVRWLTSLIEVCEWYPDHANVGTTAAGAAADAVAGAFDTAVAGAPSTSAGAGAAATGGAGAATAGAGGATAATAGGTTTATLLAAPQPHSA